MHPKSIEASERRSGLILGRLGLDWSDIRDKKVLDVGSGNCDLANAGKSRGAEIFSIDPCPDLTMTCDLFRSEMFSSLITFEELDDVRWDFDAFMQLCSTKVDSLEAAVLFMHANDYRRQFYEKLSGIPYVCARAEAIPFADDTFEVVLAHASPPILSPTRDIVLAGMNESLRVMKPEGIFRFAPVSMTACIDEHRERLGRNIPELARLGTEFFRGCCDEIGVTVSEAGPDFLEVRKTGHSSPT